jgi:hypothetical protein
VALTPEQKLVVYGRIIDTATDAIEKLTWFLATKARLNPDKPDSEITLTAAQKQTFRDLYQTLEGQLKADAASL